ncbi:hypothetical protein [Streptomyces sp. SLBN-8D4]|uniref:hypothetical protein n=1 Tax=Streptomyces sp. SLBN-8D4 TaxID=3377728 RepID=UPI003C7B6F97
MTLLGLRSMMGQDAFVSSAWRIPFVIGVGLAVVGYVLRRRATTDRPLATVLKTHRSHVVRLTFLRAANIARCRIPVANRLGGSPTPFVAAREIHEVDVRYR